MREDFAPEYRPWKSTGNAKINAHFAKSRYGNFELTDAVRPAFGSSFVPTEGYKLTESLVRSSEKLLAVPTLMIAVTRASLLPLLRDLITPLGKMVHVVITTTYPEPIPILTRENIDPVVIDSVLSDDIHTDVLQNDGYMDFSVLNKRGDVEVELNKGRNIVITGRRLDAFRDILSENNIPHKPTLQCISELEDCIYQSNDLFRDQLLHLASDLQMDPDNDSDTDDPNALFLV